MVRIYSFFKKYKEELLFTRKCTFPHCKQEGMWYQSIWTNIPQNAFCKYHAQVIHWLFYLQGDFIYKLKNLLTKTDPIAEEIRNMQFKGGEE